MSRNVTIPEDATTCMKLRESMTSFFLSHNYWRIWDVKTNMAMLKSDITLQMIVADDKVVGSHVLLDILIKCQKSMYITMKCKLTNLVLTT